VTRLTDRLSERTALSQLAEAVQAGESRALVVRGDPGVGKTALLDHLAGQASGSACRVARATGVQSEMELAFAGLHQLCAPMLNRADRLPEPQRDALHIALGLAAGPPPDRFLVGLAVLSLLSEMAAERPLICMIDDEQWLDRASAQALGFAARRLAADPVGVVFAAREPGPELAGLPQLEVRGLRDDDARALLASARPGASRSPCPSSAGALAACSAGHPETGPAPFPARATGSRRYAGAGQLAPPPGPRRGRGGWRWGRLAFGRERHGDLLESGGWRAAG
jgi:hypothetical protein